MGTLMDYSFPLLSNLQECLTAFGSEFTAPAQDQDF